MTKDFREHFYNLLGKLRRSENFAFTRFSDGELRVLQNVELELAPKHNIIDTVKTKGCYAPENLKHFIPEKHGFYRDKLFEAYRFKKKNYKSEAKRS